MATTPNVGQVWRSITGREVEIEDIIRGEALARDLETGALSLLPLFLLSRTSGSAWTYARQAGD